jgi:serine/threonine-protein kinase
MDPASPHVGPRRTPARPTSSGIFAADRFRLEAHLSSDALGDVWRARDARSGRAVAVRLLPEWLLPDADAEASFARKARALQQLHHPGIVRVLAADAQSVPAVLATELPKGTPLDASLPARGIPAGQVAAMLAPVAEALAAAHAANVVHGDLRPANILVGRQPRIIGFGLATFASRHGQRPVGLVIGDPDYWSPEQAHGRPLTRAADIFALGRLIDRLVSRDTRPELAPLIAAMTSRGVRARPAASDVADELREVARRDSAPLAAPARVVQFRPRPPVPPPAPQAATPEPMPPRLVPPPVTREPAPAPPAPAANGALTPAANGAATNGAASANGTHNGATAHEAAAGAAAAVVAAPPQAPPPAPAPEAASTRAAPAPAGPTERRGRRRGLLLAAAAVPLLAAGAFAAVRATSGGSAQHAASTAAATVAPAPTTPTVAAPAQTTPAVALRAFPGHTCRFSIPAGWQPIWADLNHQATYANVATGPGDARVDCEAPARHGARAAAAALAGAREDIRGLPGLSGLTEQQATVGTLGARRFAYDYTDVSGSTPVMEHVERVVTEDGADLSVTVAAGRASALQAEADAILGSYRPTP